MITEPTFCGSYSCAAEEQCDDCWLIDHEKECGWCEDYDHATRRLEVQHDTGERTWNVYVMGPKWEEEAQAFADSLADQEAKHGEERIPANE